MAELILCSNTYRKFDTCVELIRSSIRGTKQVLKHIVMDNSKGGFVAYLRDNSIEDLVNTDVMVMPVNMGCARAWNIFLKTGYELNPEAYVVISNDDIGLFEDSLQVLSDYIDNNPGKEFYVSGGMEAPNAFSFFAARYDILMKEIGLFDEFFLYPYEEDTDMQIRVWLAGSDLARVPGLNLTHVGSATLKSYDPIELEQHHMSHRRNEEYVYMKWNVVGQSMHQHGYNRLPFNGSEIDEAMAKNYLRKKYGS